VKDLRVVVAHPNAQHSHRLAVALQKAGMLAGYYTGMYSAWNQPPFNLVGWLPGPILQRIERRVFDRFRRSHPELDPDLVTSIGAWTNLAMALLFRSGVQAPWYRLPFRGRLVRFQRQVAEASLRTADVMVLYNGNAYPGFLATQGSRLIRVLDMASVHPATRDAIFRAEAARWPKYSGNMVILSERPDMFAQTSAEAGMADYLLAGSAWVKSTCVENGVDPARVFVVRYGVDTSVFQPGESIQRKAENSTFRILFVGGASAAKGFPYLLQMLEQLNDCEIEVLCCGIGTIPQVGGFDLGRVRLNALGLLPHAELAGVMRGVDALCHPSVLEGFSLTCLEGMASGLPVLTTHRSGTGEIIIDGENGFVVPVGDPSAMARVVGRLIQDRDLGQRVGAAARATAEEYTWRMYEQNVAAVFHEIARREEHRLGTPGGSVVSDEGDA
jgi:glycosyltransferase involved in cell wall biosynthesis